MSWARWLRRVVLGAVFVAALGRDADHGALPAPSWLRQRQDLQLVDRTFPARWTTSTRWTVEVEVDLRGMRGHTPRRAIAEYRVIELVDGRALVDVASEYGGIFGSSWNTRFAWDTVRFRVAALSMSDYRPPEALGERGWLDVEEARPPTCQSPIAAWGTPIVSRALAGGDMLDVLGERWFVGERWFRGIDQRAWVEDGMVRFELRSSDAEQATLYIAWRPGDPWWAKLECHVPGRSANPPTPPRQPWEVPRNARARLVAVDGVHVEPLRWEYPPADWMDPSGR